MRLVLIGDIHAHRLCVPPWHLMGKAVFGQMNLWLRRRRKFDLSLLPGVVARAVGLRPDLVLLSGDLTTTAYRGEFADVAAVLGPLLAVAPAVAIPGNHDRYTVLSTIGKYFEQAFPGQVPERFPFLGLLDDVAGSSGDSDATVVRQSRAAFRVLQAAAKRGVSSKPEVPSGDSGQWHLLALDVSRPTLFSSRGLAGKRQLSAAREALAGLSPLDGLLVLCHYSLGKPPQFPPSPRHHLLADAAEVTALLAGFPGRVVYMHGHVHRPWIWPRPEAGLERVVDVNAGAPCYVVQGFPRGQGFWEIELSPRVADPIEFKHHQLAAAEGDTSGGGGRGDAGGSSGGNGGLKPPELGQGCRSPPFLDDAFLLALDLLVI